MMPLVPDIILGSPGCGKTTALLDILEQELKAGTHPSKIALLTFTRRAAQEAVERVLDKFDLERKSFPHFRTIHSLAMRFSGLTPNSLLQGARLGAFAKWIGEPIQGRLSVDGTWDGYARGDRLLFMEGLARARKIDLSEQFRRDHDDIPWLVAEKFSRGLKKYKEDYSLYDYNDMLSIFAERGVQPNIDVLLVDEAQDLSLLQWDVVYKLAKTCRRVVICGDDDQAIFEWSGADADTLIDLPGQVNVLGQSFRIPSAVQDVANNIISRVKHRRPKEWKPRPEVGSVRRVGMITSTTLAPEGSVLILARNRYQLDTVAELLKRSGQLYMREGEPSVKQDVLDAIITWERLRNGEPQYVSAIVDGPYHLMSVDIGVKRGFKQLPGFDPKERVDMAALVERGGLLRNDVWYEALNRLPISDRIYIKDIRRNRIRLSQTPRITLSTIHGSKGGEADQVILLTDLAPRTSREMDRNPAAEFRTFYVGVTRARQELCVVSPQTKLSFPIAI
jgi:superfamily I DNA/RNA helicase